MSLKFFCSKLQNVGLENDVHIIETPSPTRTAVEAAGVHHVDVSNIIKSLLVKIDDQWKIYLVPGSKKLDLDAIRINFPDKEVRMATPDEVKEITGYSIGGVPPFGHIQNIETEIYEGFNKEQLMIAAAGSSNTIFKCTYDELVELLKKFGYKS